MAAILVSDPITPRAIEWLREQGVDAELLAAGIGPGHPSLYPAAGDPGRSEEPDEG